LQLCFLFRISRCGFSKLDILLFRLRHHHSALASIKQRRWVQQRLWAVWLQQREAAEWWHLGREASLGHRLQHQKAAHSDSFLLPGEPESGEMPSTKSQSITPPFAIN